MREIRNLCFVSIILVFFNLQSGAIDDLKNNFVCNQGKVLCPDGKKAKCLKGNFRPRCLGKPISTPECCKKNNNSLKCNSLLLNCPALSSSSSGTPSSSSSGGISTPFCTEQGIMCDTGIPLCSNKGNIGTAECRELPGLGLVAGCNTMTGFLPGEVICK